MEQFQELWQKYRYLLGGLVVVAGVGAAVLLNQAPTVASVELLPSDSPEPTVELTVDVAGAVAAPGIKRLPAGALVEDAIAAAGGFTREADLSRIAKELNRADKLKPNQKVYVPPVGQPAVAAAGADPSSASATVETGGKVNINTADVAELDALPGVGPAIAQRIIDYRTEQGPFGSPEDLKEVPGIGDATYEKLAERITI